MGAKLDLLGKRRIPDGGPRRIVWWVMGFASGEAPIHADESLCG